MTNTVKPSDVLHYDPSDPDVRINPYPLYHQLRDQDPVHWNPPGAWFITRYADVSALLRDPRLGSDRRKGTELPPELRARASLPLMVSLDPPDHTRLRALVSKAFTPRQVERLRDSVRAIANRLLDNWCGDQVNLIDTLARPLPVEVVCELLGVPDEDRPRVHRCSTDLIYLFEPLPTEQQLERGVNGWAGLTDYFRELVALRRREPAEDLLSMLITVHEAGDRLSGEELVSMAALLMFAGHDTTVNLIGNGTLALLRHPDELALLRSDPLLIDSAVEELLRYDAPVQVNLRLALTDLEVNGRKLRAGQGVLLCPGAANRDPDQFPDPDRLDITRPGASRHLSFGGGPHYCLGAPLARLEARIVLATVFERYPELALAGEPVWRDTTGIRGLRELNLTSG